MSRYDFFFGLIRIPLELAIVVLAFWIARDIRITTDLIPGIQLPTRTIETQYLLMLAGVSYGVLGTIFAFQKLYTIEVKKGIIEEIFLLTRGIIAGFFIIIGIIYLTNGFPYETILIPRLILIYAFLFILGGVIVERMGVRYLRLWLLGKKWFPKKKTLLILHHSEPHIEHSLLTEKGRQYIGYLAPFLSASTLPYRGTIQNYREVIEKHDVEEILMIGHDLPHEIQKNLFEYCQIHGITYRYTGNLYETGKNNTHIDFIGRIPFVEIRHSGITPWGRIVKRTFDIILGCILLLIMIPCGLVLSLIIVLDSPGFPLYVSQRVGRNGKIFSMMKFRSMVRDAEQKKQAIYEKNERQNSPLFKVQHDPRITRIGRWLRRWSVDELAQVVNVIRGDMSFIGPRPHLPEEVQQYTEKHKQVLTIKPGITGMAQVYGRDKNSFDREIELDLFYIENWSLLLDTKILLLTFRAVFQGK